MIDETKKRVGLLGGTFDPIHFGHLGLADEAKERFQLRSVLFIPAHVSPHKRDAIPTDPRHRLNMIRLALEGESDYDICEFEIQRGGLSYTIDTLEALKSRDSQAEYFILLGMDAFLDFGKWRAWQQILERSNLRVAVRPRITAPPPEEALKKLFDSSALYRPVPEGQDVFIRENWRDRVAFFEPPPRNISSSEIRHLLSENQPVKNLLPPKVERYIIDHHLYQANSQPFKE